MSAVAPKYGPVRRLDRASEPDERVTVDDLKSPDYLARLLMRILRELADLRRRWWPKRIDVEDRDVDGTGSTKYRFPHGFGGRVRWWVVDWSGASSVAGLMRHSDSDNNTLVLVSWVAGTVTVRIEEAG